MKFVFGWHSQDSRATGPLKVADTVTAQYGTGGVIPRLWYRKCLCRASDNTNAEVAENMATTLKACNVPVLAAEVEKCICIQGSMIGRADTNDPQGSGTLQAKESGGWSLNYINPVIESSNPAGVLCMASTQANSERLMDCGTTLNLDKDRTIIAHKNEAAVNYTFGKTSRPHFKGDAPTYRQLDTANTVNTFDTGESRANELAVQGVPPHYIVRRLMPIECGRLQGLGGLHALLCLRFGQTVEQQAGTIGKLGNKPVRRINGHVFVIHALHPFVLRFVMGLLYHAMPRR